MVFFKGEKFNHQWSMGEVSGTLYSMSENRWIDQELFFLWLDKLLPPASRNNVKLTISAHCPVLLMLDGHGLHFIPDVLRKASDKGIMIFFYPP